MRSGVRFQLGVSLTGLFLLAFLPLLLAISSLSRVSHRAAEREHAAALARAVAAAAPALDERLLRAMLGPDDAVALYDRDGARVLAVGRDAERLPARCRAGERPVSREGAAWAVAPHPDGTTIVQAQLTAGKSLPLVRFVAVYAVAAAMAMLAVGYAVVGRVIVLPLGRLAEAAERVIAGVGKAPAIEPGARELLQLSTSFATMTTKLQREEARLRAKVDELERVTRELRASQAQLVKSERLASVGRLSAGLAHEIGNPLAALLGLQDLLIDGGLTDEEERDFLERMRKETARIHRIVRDLLAFARGDAAGDATVDVPGEVARAASEVASLLAPQRDLKGRALSVDVEAELPAVALAHGHLVQVLLNLALNAAQATSDGGRVVIAAALEGERVVVRVDDDGPGVAEEVQPSLFEPFVTTKEVGEGTGLGLAVCRGLVEAAGGSISAGGSPLGGARFTVELPVAARA
ncbi:MAG: two-component sensor histidine kinase [Polyangiaceae bacterium]|nr:two-component sensor histidine kinase [Polyangiaceae bacterium]